MRDSDITKLRRKRARINAQIRKLEPLLAHYYEALWQVEQAIKSIAPELDLPVRKRAPHPYFARRELPRLIMDILREPDAGADDRGPRAGDEGLHPPRSAADETDSALRQRHHGGLEQARAGRDRGAREGHAAGIGGRSLTGWTHGDREAF
jgi:hypothetical protein